MSTIPNRQHTVKREGVTHTRAGAILTDLIIPVIRLEAHFSRAGEAIAAAAGQTLARWLTLAMVADEPSTVAQVARKLDLTRQSVQRIADLLAAEGLAEYHDNPAHRRAKLLALTPRGREALAIIQAGQRTWANAVGAEVAEADLRRASETIGAVLAAMARHPPAGSLLPRGEG